ncbi:MAG: sugar ABC transporter substrate-binding protein [Chloroflexota bacterium]
MFFRNKRTLLILTTTLILIALGLAACGQPETVTVVETVVVEKEVEVEKVVEVEKEVEITVVETVEVEVEVEKIVEVEVEAEVEETLPYGLKPGKPYEGTELTFLICCPAAAQFAAWADSVEEFRELTGINVTFTNDPLGGLREKIVTESLGNPGSWDTTIYFGTWGPSLAQFLEPIETYKGEIDTNLLDYPNSSRQIAQIDGVTYGIPVRSHVMMFYYREDVFEELGLDVPTTWDDLSAAAQAINEADNDTYGITMNWANQGGGISLMPWTNMLRTNGSDLFDDNWRPIFNNEAGIEATEFYASLLAHAPPGAPTYNEGDMRNSFASGEAAMALGWSWSYNIFTREDTSEEIVRNNVGYTAAIPGPAKGSDPIAMAWPMAISASSENKEAAVEWIKWMTNPDLDLQVIADKSDPTRNTVVANRLSSLLSDEANASDANDGFSEAMGNAYSTASPEAVYIEFPEVSVILEAALSEIAGGADVQSALDAAAEEVTEVMERSGRYN